MTLLSRPAPASCSGRAAHGGLGAQMPGSWLGEAPGGRSGVSCSPPPCVPCAAPGLRVGSVGLCHVQSSGSVSVPGKAVRPCVCARVCAHVCVRAPCPLTEPQCVLLQP